MSAPSGKSRGCFQCSKRRIICDNTQPKCQKCQKKGLECSGAARIRFSNAVALRGKLKGCTIPVMGEADSGIDPQPRQEHQITPRIIRWKDDQSVRPKRKYLKRRATTTVSDLDKSPTSTVSEAPNEPDTNTGVDRPEVSFLPQEDVPGTSTGASIAPGRFSHSERSTLLTPYGSDVSFGRAIRGNDSHGMNRKTGHSIPPWIDPLGSGTRMLFSHFAMQVAPVMVILDDVSNGYRDVLLPLACEDKLLQRAICIVATQHLALHNSHYKSAVDQSRAAVISQLRRDSLQSSPDRIFNVSTWATLIVLLVGETITGSSECGHMLQTLISLARNIGRATPSGLTHFLQQQTQMFELLGQPLLGTFQGGDSLNLPVEQYLDWTFYNLPSHSEHNDLLHLSRLAFMKAFQIYIGRKTTNGDQWELLESLTQLVAQIDPDQMGSHALVWVCFIGAADSTDPAHRRFFTDRMNSIYVKTKFQNIAAGMQSLPRIWSQQGSGRWTENLFRLAPALVI